MRVLYSYLRTHFTAHFQWRVYGSVAAFVGALIAFNYATNFERTVIQTRSFAGQWALFFCLHAASYFGVVALVAWHTTRTAFLTHRSFWVKSLVGLAMLCAYRAFPYAVLVPAEVPRGAFSLALMLAKHSVGWLAAALVLLALYAAFDRRSGGDWYGLTLHNANLRPYAGLFAVVALLACGASFFPSFLRAYPRYSSTQGTLLAAALEWPDWSPLWGFELTYLSTFIFVELFFRGFLVLGMDKHLGRDAVLPMAATYAVFHFGRPMGETIGSAIGACVLGAIALESRNIWGGILVHMTLALAMELFAHLQKVI